MDDLLEEAQHFRLEGSKLKACLKDNDGGWRNAELDLDRYIGNTDGHLTWFGQDFSKDAKDIRIVRHCHKPELVATLRSDDGDEIMNQLLLGEKIENSDGAFSMKKDTSPHEEEDPFWRQNMSLGV